jgi:hypothetical protein
VAKSTAVYLVIAAALVGVGYYFWQRSQATDDGSADDGSADDSTDDGSGAGAPSSALDTISNFAATVTSRVVNLATSRGYRNNNPGNLRYLSSNAWNGQVSNDNGYGVYDSPENGTRALGHQLQAYGLDTVRDIITRWAPSSDGNNTDAYVTDVADQLGFGPDDSLDVGSLLPQLAAAIAKHENGYLDSSYDWSWVYNA